MPDSLEIRLLGPFEVLSDGRPVEVSGSKRHAMLAMLALRRGRVVGVDALVDALWGEELPAAPRNALQHHVMRDRAALGRDAIVGAHDGYSLPDAAVDALRFEELLGETPRGPARGRRQRGRGCRRLRSCALARSRAARPDRNGLVRRRGAAARGAPRRRAGGAVRGRARAWRASRDRSRTPGNAEGQPVPRAAVGPADARSLPQRPPGGRTRDLPGGTAACSPRSWDWNRGRSSGGSRRRSSLKILRSLPMHRRRAVGATFPPRQRRSWAASKISPGWSSSSASIGW